MQKLMRLPEVRALTRRSRSVIYRDMDAGKFPKPVKLGDRAVAWIASEVEDWVNNRIKAREAA